MRPGGSLGLSFAGRRLTPEVPAPGRLAVGSVVVPASGVCVGVGVALDGRLGAGSLVRDVVVAASGVGHSREEREDEDE